MKEMMQITQDNPMIVTSMEQLEQVMYKVLEKCGVKASIPEKRELVVTEMPTRLARKHLQDKGHRVISDPAFNTLITEYQIPRRKKGKEYWYKVADLDRIPPR